MAVSLYLYLYFMLLQYEYKEYMNSYKYCLKWSYKKWNLSSKHKKIPIKCFIRNFELFYLFSTYSKRFGFSEPVIIINKNSGFELY